MRGTKAPSEVSHLVAPIAGVLDWAWRRMHWWVALMAALYCLSGITIVKSDEVAVVLRWGHLVGTTRALQEHGPGLLFSFPRPVDQVIRVQVKHVWEVPVTDLTSEDPEEVDDNPRDAGTLNPITQGYALTADQNVVQTAIVARYRVSDPVQWALYGPKAEDVLRVEVTSAMVRSFGEMGVDRVLSDGRKALIETATRRAQAGLDAAHSGLELTSLELSQLSPPAALAADFDNVQSAFIAAETVKNEAQALAQSAIPQAQADADSSIQAARGDAEKDLAQAKGDSGAFLALEKEYRASPEVVRERLYRDAVEKAIGAATNIRWVPPPTGGSYNGFRITLAPNPAGNAPSSQTSDATVQPSHTPVPPPPTNPEDEGDPYQ